MEKQKMQLTAGHQGIAGVVIAGGQAVRMHYRDKPLLPLGGKLLLEHVLALASPQVSRLIINVNQNLDRYRQFQLPLVKDLSAEARGPLVGICSAMRWYCERDTTVTYLATFPADVPAFPRDIVRRLQQVLETRSPGYGDSGGPAEPVVWCRTGDQIQPLFALWPMTLLPVLEDAIQRGIHGPKLFFQNNPNLILEMPAPQPPLFMNINTPDDLLKAEQYFSRSGRP